MERSLYKKTFYDVILSVIVSLWCYDVLLQYDTILMSCCITSLLHFQDIFYYFDYNIKQTQLPTFLSFKVCLFDVVMDILFLYICDLFSLVVMRRQVRLRFTSLPYDSSQLHVSSTLINWRSTVSIIQ